jgi:hypothetical protein
MPSTPNPANQPVEVLEMNEAFEQFSGCFKFTGTLIVYRAHNLASYHHNWTSARLEETVPRHEFKVRREFVVTKRHRVTQKAMF